MIVQMIIQGITKLTCKRQRNIFLFVKLPLQVNKSITFKQTTCLGNPKHWLRYRVFHTMHEVEHITRQDQWRREQSFVHWIFVKKYFFVCEEEAMSGHITIMKTTEKGASSWNSDKLKWLPVSMWKDPGGRLNKKDGLTRYGDSHVKDKTS